jgi:hypothetical protein
MMTFALACLSIGVVAFLIAVGICIRPGLRIRSLLVRLEKHPSLRAAEAASGSLESVAAALERLDVASRRFDTAADTINAAAVSVGAFASQIAIVAAVVDSLLDMFVPRLRGMLS